MELKVPFAERQEFFGNCHHLKNEHLHKLGGVVIVSGIEDRGFEKVRKGTFTWSTSSCQPQLNIEDGIDRKAILFFHF
jgi:hypothetical protein